MATNHKSIGRLLSLLLTLCMVVGAAPAAVSATEPLSEEVEINETNFPDANFRECVRSYDQDHNEILSPEEIVLVETLEADRAGIKSLQGIEHFTELKVLICNDNQLESLDLSQNQDLEELICDHNKLTRLDLGQNTELEILYCGFNRLKMLDLSKNTALRELECSLNWLTSLDVSHNTALKKLSCIGNKLESLDVSKNLSLVSLECAGNELTCLNLTSNKNLEVLDCFQNHLETLDFGENPKLDFLDCGKNLLTSLDLWDHTRVRVVMCDYNMYVIPERENFDYTALPGNFNIGKVSQVVGGEFHQERHAFTMSPDVNKAEYSYQVRPDRKVTFGFYHNPFTDIKKDAYYYHPVIWAAGNKVTDGITATTFTPKENCTRGQVMTFLWRLAGRPEPETMESPFADVQDPSRFYYKAVLWAVENGITNGITPELYKPDSTCTRGQVVTFLWRLTDGSRPVSTVCRFDDVQNPEAYYYEAVLWATEELIASGVQPGIFKPEDTCNRAQIVTFIYRFMV